MYKNKYAKLHEVVLSTYENEKTLLSKAKELHHSLGLERIKLEEKSQLSTSNSNLVWEIVNCFNHADSSVEDRIG